MKCMAQDKRLIDANALMEVIRQHEYPLATKQGAVDYGMFTLGIQQAVDEQTTADAVEVVRIEEVKQIILQTFDNLIVTHRDISNSHFYDPEKHLGIPQSGDDYYGIYADVMEIARRLVNAALNELCSYGERKDNVH